MIPTKSSSANSSNDIASLNNGSSSNSTTTNSTSSLSSSSSGGNITKVTRSVNPNVKNALMQIYKSEAMVNGIIKSAEDYEKKNTKYKYKPYIRAVTKHWFRDLDFKDAYVVSDDSKNIGQWMAGFPVTKDDGTVENISTTFEIEEYSKGDIFQVSEPKIVGKEYTVDLTEVENGKADAKDAAEDDSSILKTAQNVISGFLTNASEDDNKEEKTDENRTASDVIASNYEGYRLDNLFKQKYNIADGINGVSEDKRTIQAKITMRYAITMLENVGTEDSQCILRDLKRYLTKRGFTFTNQYIITDPDTIKDDENEQDKLYENVNQYEGEEYVPPDGDKIMRPYKGTSGRGGTSGATQKPLGGILDGGIGGVEISEDRLTIIMHHKSPNHTDGFDTGVDVKSPGDGQIKISGDTAIIKLTTQGVRDYTITIKGFKPNFNGTTVKRGDVIGQTGDGDITVTMTDARGKPVSPANYLPIISAIDVTDEEFEMLAKCLAGEDGGSEEGMAAVAYVIFHRVACNYDQFAYQNTISEVINAPNQFTGKNGPATNASRNVARNCLSGVTPDPLEGVFPNGAPSLFFLSWGRCFPGETREQLLAEGYYPCGGNVFSHDAHGFNF